MLSREEIMAADPEAFESSRVMDMDVAQRNLLAIKEILDSRGIRFWLCFGTLLGVYRNGALIPWDGDSDLVIYVEDMLKFFRCESLFEQQGFKFSNVCIYRDHEHTDIIFFYPDPLRVDKRVSGPFQIDATAFDITNTIQFLGQEWRILSDPERWLRYIYGDNWRTPIRDFTSLGVPCGGPACPCPQQNVLLLPNCVLILYSSNSCKGYFVRIEVET